MFLGCMFYICIMSNPWGQVSCQWGESYLILAIIEIFNLKSVSGGNQREMSTSPTGFVSWELWIWRWNNFNLIFHKHASFLR